MKKFLKFMIIVIIDILLVTFVIFMIKSLTKRSDKTVNNSMQAVELDDEFFDVDFYEETKGKLCEEKFTNAIPFGYNITAVSQNGKWAFIDRNGNLLTEYIYTKVMAPYEGFFCVQKGDKYGFINEECEEITEFIYDEESRFLDENVAFVTKDEKYGVINSKGEQIIECKYVDFSFSEQTFLFKTIDGNYELFDEEGNFINTFEADGVFAFKEGIALVQKDGKCGYIDKTGKTIIDFKYDSGIWFTNGVTSVYDKENDEMIFIDKEDNILYKASRSDIGDMEDVTSIGFTFKRDGKCGIINKYGETIVDFEYDEIEDFSEDGYAKVLKDDKYGFIDKDGNVIIEPKYDEASNLYDGTASVKIYDTWYFIDEKGNLAVKKKYDYDYVSNFMDGISIVMKDYKCGFLNRDGELIIGDLSNTIDIEYTLRIF